MDVKKIHNAMVAVDTLLDLSLDGTIVYTANNIMVALADSPLAFIDTAIAINEDGDPVYYKGIHTLTAKLRVYDDNGENPQYFTISEVKKVSLRDN